MGGDEFVNTNILGAKRLLDWVATHEGVRAAARVDRRGVRRRRGAAPLARGRPPARLVALRRRQGGRRADGVRLRAHVRHQRLDRARRQRLRPEPVPREVHPGARHQHARGPAAAGLRRRPAGARVHARQRLRGRHRGRAAARQGRRGVQLRLRGGADQPRDGAPRGRDPRRRRGADPARRRPARARPPVRDRLREARAPSAGRRASASPPACARRSSGTARTSRGGAPSRPAPTTPTTWPRTTAAGPAREGHRPRGRRRLAPASRDARHLEAAAAGLRQADGLLPAVDADAGGHPRDPRHLDAARPAALPAPAGRRLAVRHPAQLRGAGPAPRPRRRVRGRPVVHRRRRRRAGARRQHLPRRGPRRHPPGRGRAARRLHAVRLPGARSRALRRRRGRRPTGASSASRRSPPGPAPTWR